MREENKNLLLAIVLSVAVLIGWQYFFAPPPKPPQPQPPTAQTQQAPAAPSPSQAGGPAAPAPGTAAPAPAAPGAAPMAAESREAALARSPRVAIDTPSIKGSISLRGGRIDDVSLKNYRETVDPTSPNIVLFSPPGARTPTTRNSAGSSDAPGVALPGPDTLWTADRTVLTDKQPVTLTYDNGQGLIFRRCSRSTTSSCSP